MKESYEKAIFEIESKGILDLVKKEREILLKHFNFPNP
jgi:hypothetical protein